MAQFRFASHFSQLIISPLFGRYIAKEVYEKSANWVNYYSGLGSINIVGDPRIFRFNWRSWLPIMFSLKWIVTSVFGIFGYIALTSVSWGLKLKHKTRLVFLIFGLLALAFTYWSGVHFDGEMFKLGSSWFEFYLFLCPAIFLIIHIVLHLVWVRKAI